MPNTGEKLGFFKHKDDGKSGLIEKQH